MLLDFLHNDFDLLLHEVPCDIRMQMYYMHDGASAHHMQIVIEYLETRFQGRWTGSNSPQITWPPPSPDLIPPWFFCVGYLKSLVYTTEINLREVLIERKSKSCNALKADEAMLQRITNEVIHRATLCYDNQGIYLEIFL